MMHPHRRLRLCALMSFLAAGLVIASFVVVPAVAYAQCDNIEDPTPKRVKQCKKDNGKMHKLCDQKRSCKKVTDSKTALKYAAVGDKCAKAREKQGEDWFGGNDARHQRVIDDVKAVADACRKKAKALKKQGK